jgi:hypothetical protein
LDNLRKAWKEVVIKEEKESKVENKGPGNDKTVKKRGFFARFLERLAKENEKTGGQVCRA